MSKETNDESVELDTVDDPQAPVADDEPEPEWQRARHEVQSEDLQAADENHPLNQARGGETGSINQKVEDEVMLDYISDKIYGGPEATVREYLANAETACVRAAEQMLREEMDPTDEDFLVEHPENPDVMVRKPAQQILDAASEVGYNATIQVEWHRDDDLLIIQDNGIGFTPREVTDIMAWAGRSGVRDRGDVSGQFGMGLMSWVKASDKKGAMTMVTRTRRTDVPGWAQESFGTYIKLTDQDPVDGMKLPEGQYGTRFEIPLDPDLQDEFGRRRDDNPVIRKWVIKYAENMRIPVTYDEYEDGATSYDEEYGGNELVDDDFGGALLEMDRPGFYAACYPDSSSETLLLSMDIDRNGGNPRNAPWSVDVRFRNENGMVVSGPNAGKTPVSEAEYTELKDDQKHRFVKEDDVQTDDITLPIPTADRDRLQRQSQGQFWDWLGEQFQDEYKELLRDVIDDVDGADNLLKMAEDEPSRFSFLMTGLTNQRGYGNKTASNLQDRFEKELNHTFSEEECELLLDLLDSISLAPRGRSGVSKKNQRKTEKVWRIHRQAVGDGGQVFMGKSINEDRCEVAWNSHDSNQVVKLEQGESYSSWKDTFGWTELKEVPLSLDDDDDDTQFEIPDNFSASQNSKSNAGKPPEDRDLTIRQDKGQKKSRNYSVAEIEQTLEEANDDKRDTRGLKISYSGYVDNVVLFPSDTDENVSDWYDLAWGDRAVATCIKKVYEYLKDVPGIMHIDDLIQDSMQVSLETNEGTKTVAEAGDRLLIHVVDDEYLERFRDDTVMQTIADHLTEWVPKNEGKISYSYSTPSAVKEKGFIYAPVDLGSWKKLNAGNIETQTLVIGGHQSPRGGTHSYSFKSDVTLYAVGRLHEWDGSDEVTAVKEVTDRNDPEVGLSVVDTLAMLHDNGVQPSSVLDDDIEVSVTEKQQTLDDATDDDSAVDGGLPDHEVIADGGD